MDSFKVRATLLLRTISSHGMNTAQYAQVNVENTGAFMGLESHLTPSAAIRMRERRRAVGRAVRLEQSHQNLTGIFDPDAMRRASEAISGESFKRARVITRLHASNDSERR